MKAEGREKRGYPRSGGGPVRIIDDSDTMPLNQVENISGSGVLCHSVEAIPLMKKMSLVLELPEPHERRVKCEGVVVRCEGSGSDFKVAVEFTDLSDEDRQAILDFVRRSLAVGGPG